MAAFKRNPLYVNPVMELLEPVVAALMSEEKGRLNTELHHLVLKNQGLGGSLDAFFYAGELFSLLPRRFLRNQEIRTIHKSLVPDIENLRQLYAQLETDTKKLRQAMSVVLPKCRHKQDVRDAFPDALCLLVPELQAIERLNPEDSILQENPLLRAQFQKAIDIAGYYTANKLIY